jgi:hypothetical protein
MRLGDPTETPCPRSNCYGQIVYNGNYFCDTCDWSAPDKWLYRNPSVYTRLMDGRSKRWSIPVTNLINFNQELYDKGKS